MKLHLTDEWCLAAAELEGDQEVGAGAIAADPINLLSTPAETLVNRGVEQVAFGRLIQLLRRGKSLTIEQLAVNARVEIEELFLIEKDLEYRPEPRTVHQLAHVFQMKPKALLQLSGSAVPRQDNSREAVKREAVKFAASSEPMGQLTKEEAQAVEHFVAALNRLADTDKDT